jgi:hypothetical protein
LPPDALELAFAEAGLLALPVAVEAALAVLVAAAVAVPVGVSVALSPGLLLVLSVGELLAESAGDALGGVTGLADVADLASMDDGELGGHAVTCPLLWAAELLPGPTPPADALPWVPDPVRLGTPPLVLVLELELEWENPTAVPSWTKAPRSGGIARATPMANTAQAAARAGRNSPYRQSRCCRSPAPFPSCPPRAAFQRRTMSARKPPLAAACLLA